jgi:DNA-binding HxlR family transcriptional regulator
MATDLEVVSERMLSERLKELEKLGVASRRVIPGPPVGVEYELTEKGRALGSVISEIGRWAETWIEAPATPIQRRAR